MLKGKCIICKKQFFYKPSSNIGKFCSYKCYWKSMKGKIGFNKGKKASKETRYKQRIAKLGRKFPNFSIAKKKYYKTHDGYWKGKKFSKSHIKNMSKSKIGKKMGETHPNWKGGKWVSDQGYIFAYCPNHPRQRKNHVRNSHIVMEKHLKRYLTKEEVVHHINKIRSDDRPENLRLFPSKSAHRIYHSRLHLRIVPNKVNECKSHISPNPS